MPEPVRCRRLLASALALALLAACGSGDDKPTDAAVDGLGPVNLSYDDLLSACVRLAACEIERHPFLRDCANNYYDRLVAYGQRNLYAKLYTCVNQGGASCKTIRECMGFAGRPKACTETYPSECKGNVAYSCDLIHQKDGWEQALDCSKGGLKCGVKDTGTTKVAVCGGGTCSGTTSVCDARRRITCVGGALEIDDCPEQQLQCRDPAVGKCEGTGRSCASIKSTCNGSSLVSCREGYVQEIDCAALPGKKTCDPTTTTCRGTGKECDMDGAFDACEGDTLVVCVDGYKRRYDCKQLGFLGCKKADTYGAYCEAEPVYE